MWPFTDQDRQQRKSIETLCVYCQEIRLQSNARSLFQSQMRFTRLSVFLPWSRQLFTDSATVHTEDYTTFAALLCGKINRTLTNMLLKVSMRGSYFSPSLTACRQSEIRPGQSQPTPARQHHVCRTALHRSNKVNHDYLTLMI